jgi:hypothetical protein
MNVKNLIRLEELKIVSIDTRSDEIIASRRGINERDLARFLFKIVPNCPRISKNITIYSMNIKSLCLIANNIELIKQKTSARISSCYTRAHLKVYNPSGLLHNKCSLLRVFRYFPGLVIEFESTKQLASFPKVEYALRINHAGRSLLIQDSNNNDNRSIPLSVWPIVLKRAIDKSVDVFPKVKKIDFTGLYYLIQFVWDLL